MISDMTDKILGENGSEYIIGIMICKVVLSIFKPYQKVEHVSLIISEGETEKKI